MKHRPGIDLYWIPLGAGGSGFVRFNGRVYERVVSWRDRRSILDLYHTALRVTLPETSFVVETMWPSPDRDYASRGVVLVAPVFARTLGRLRPFTYEVRRWCNGDLPDAEQAVGGPKRVASGVDPALLLLSLVDEVPPLIWGRDGHGTGEMWNSNSVISWLLTRTGVDMGAARPPPSGRAPGWDTGIVVAGSR